jgi:hypothetical protein
VNAPIQTGFSAHAHYTNQNGRGIKG